MALPGNQAERVVDELSNVPQGDITLTECGALAVGHKVLWS